ncbi:hypothetical protein LB504_003941 [Fusarium proliferatum]|nr:hypothetical protein LB504_003941 [Fusarium proliferatum]
MPPTKRKAANALDPSERKRAQNRISQQCLREKNITYIRNLEETIELLQKVATGSDPQDRYSVLLEAHLKLIAENRKLEDALLRLRKKLLSFGQAATAAADDEVFDSIFRRRDAENLEAQTSAPRTELVNHETPSTLNPSINNQSFQDIQEQATHTDIFKDASFLLDLSTAGQVQHEALTPSTMQPGDTFLDPAMSLSPRSLLFVPNQLSITSMSIFGSRLLGACRRHLDNLQDSGNSDMADKIIKTAVRFSMRCAGLESYAYGVNGAKYIERVISWRLGIESRNSVPLPFRPTPLQSKNPTHFWGIDLFNWPEIRDQLVLEAETTDFDELIKDLVLHSVIEPANHSVAVNVLDIFENQVLRRRQHQKSPQRSYFTDPSWTLFQIGPEVGEWYSSEHDIVEEAIFEELDRQINAVAPSPDDNPVEESRANDVAKFLGLDDFLSGLQLHFEATRSAWHGRRPDMATLASLGIMLALIQAVTDTVQTDMNGFHCMDPKSLEAIPILSTSILGGRLLKTILSQRNQVFASPLSNLVPTMARVYSTAAEYSDIPVDLLSSGDRVIVSQGEHIPCDGIVESTESALVIETWINGSLEPRLVENGDAVYAGGQLTQEFEQLRNATSAQTILFDKTGTLTYGDLKVTHASFSQEWYSSPKQDILWRAVQEVEAGNTHPVARGLFQESHSRLGETDECVDNLMVSGINHELGRGAQAVVTATQPGSKSTTWKLTIGSRTYIESLGISIDLSQIPVKMRTEITTAVVLAVDGKQAAVFVLQDTVRSEAHQIIRQLKDLGLTVGMITGDNANSAASVAGEVGIDSDMVFANAHPEEKSCILGRFLQRGPAIYVGDNYNDILCFASASFSVCVAGSDMKSDDADCADATLMSSETSPLSRIPLMVLLARRMRRIVMQNNCWAVVYNILSLTRVLGVGGITPPSPVWSSIGMGLSSVVVLWNSSRVDEG